jgi:hypothetical protein
VQEAMALVAGFDDVAVVRQPVQQRRRHLGVAEHPSSTPNPDFRRFPRFNLNEINELEA